MSSSCFICEEEKRCRLFRPGSLKRARRISCEAEVSVCCDADGAAVQDGVIAVGARASHHGMLKPALCINVPSFQLFPLTMKYFCARFMSVFINLLIHFFFISLAKAVLLSPVLLRGQKTEETLTF